MQIRLFECLSFVKVDFFIDCMKEICIMPDVIICKWRILRASLECSEPLLCSFYFWEGLEANCFSFATEFCLYDASLGNL